MAWAYFLPDKKSQLNLSMVWHCGLKWVLQNRNFHNFAAWDHKVHFNSGQNTKCYFILWHWQILLSTMYKVLVPYCVHCISGQIWSAVSCLGLVGTGSSWNLHSAGLWQWPDWWTQEWGEDFCAAWEATDYLLHKREHLYLCHHQTTRPPDKSSRRQLSHLQWCF